jgi:hypothetical protein
MTLEQKRRRERSQLAQTVAILLNTSTGLQHFVQQQRLAEMSPWFSLHNFSTINFLTTPQQQRRINKSDA